MSRQPSPGREWYRVKRGRSFHLVAERRIYDQFGVPVRGVEVRTRCLPGSPFRRVAEMLVEGDDGRLRMGEWQCLRCLDREPPA